MNYLICSRRCFDGLNSTDSEVMKLHGIIKPTVCLVPTLDSMFDMAQKLNLCTPPKKIIIMDPYMELHDTGLTGQVLLLKERCKEKMITDFMMKLNSSYQLAMEPVKVYGRDTKITVTPLIPVDTYYT